MCNLIKDAYQLRIKSSTNEIAQRWKKVETRFQLKEYYEYKYIENKKIRYQNRFYSTYWSNLELGRLGEDAQDTEKVCKMIVERLLVKQMGINPPNKKMSNNDKLEVLFSYVKVLSRPFLNYQWRTREAIFYLILLFLEVVLDENIKNRNDIEEFIKKSKFKYSGDIKKLRDVCGVIKDCKTIKKNGKLEDLIITYSMLIIFIKQAMELNSNYIIRKRSVIKINQKYQEIKNGLKKFSDFELENKKDEINSILDFENLYIRYIKQLTSLSGDEKKCVWLEELLLTGNEPSGEVWKIDEDFIERYGIGSDLGKKLYIENTGVIQEALESLTTELYKRKGIDKTKESVEGWLEKIINDKSRYYLKSFFDILRLN
ncbi:MAG: hypothetical protein K2I72_02870, partial [Bacilli bacterium]|nr:hypothetical protein [Bacilli bacterium]